MSSENRYRKGNDEYATPSWIKQELFHGWFDPCPMLAFPGEDREDGLNIDWFAWTFVNPPYSNPLPWIEKAIMENKKGKYQSQSASK